MSRVFTLSEHTWSGGFYELAIELGGRAEEDADARLEAAVRAALAYPEWDRPFGRSDVEPGEQERLTESGALAVLVGEESQGHVYGVAGLPDRQCVASGIMVIREEGEDAADWLDVYFPVDALAETYPGVGAYPFGPGGVPARATWSDAVNEWLVEVGRRIYAAAPFRFALVGFEASGRQTAAEVERAGGVPAERWDGYLWPEDGEPRWYPPTLFGPPFPPRDAP